MVSARVDVAGRNQNEEVTRGRTQAMLKVILKDLVIWSSLVQDVPKNAVENRS